MNKMTPKYLLVESQIRQAINENKLTGKLPGERALAREMGFSYMTIRKAVHNLVEEGLLYKVATKGTFVANPSARKKPKKIIGYYLDKSIKAGISSPYYSLIFSAIEKYAAKNDFSIVYFSEINSKLLSTTLSKLDGVIASCFPRVEDIILEIQQHLPVVVIDNSASDKSIPSITIDNFNAEIESFEYIHSLGHQRIGFMNGLEDSDVGKSRCAGYHSGLQKSGLKPDKKLLFKGNYSFESGQQGAEYFLSLKQPPTAIICANDSMAMGAIRYLNQQGLQVPNDMSIIGFDDIEVAAQITPSLTTIAAPINDLAKHAFNILDSLIRGEQPEFQHIVLPAHLVVRDSTASLAGENEEQPKLNLVRN